MDILAAGNRKLPKDAEESVKTLAMTGVKFNIINLVTADDGTGRVELHYEYTRLPSERRCVHFVCELNTYGQITEYGPYFKRPKIDRPRILNADGQDVTALAV